MKLFAILFGLLLGWANASAQLNTAGTAVNTVTLDNGDLMVTLCCYTGSVTGLTESCYFALATNQVVTINSCIGGGGPYFKINFGSNNTNVIQQGMAYASTTYYPNSPFISKGNEMTFAGGTQIALISPAASNTTALQALMTITVHTPSPNTNALSYVPTQSVVIPSDATGNVQINLESSSDLINWVTTSPGLYGNTYSNRFFRVRALKQ